MSKTKRAGLSSRNDSFSAALEASQPAKGAAEPSGSEEIVAIGIRMTKAMHRDLKMIVYHSDMKEDRKISLNSLLVEGVEMLIADRKRKGIL